MITEEDLQNKTLRELKKEKPKDLANFVQTLENEEVLAMEYAWREWARPEQIVPIEIEPGRLCSVFLYLSGRGAGKTRAATETVRERIENGQARRVGLVGRTAGDTRDVLVTGNSGLLNVCPPWMGAQYKPSEAKVVFKGYPNAEVKLYCATDDTEALTKNGWKKVDELYEGELIKTLNTETRNSEWQPIEKVHLYSVEDVPIVRTKMRSHSSRVTLDHKWPVKNKSTNKISMLDSILEFKTKHGIITGAKSSHLPIEKQYKDSFVNLVAWLTTEGHVHFLNEKLKRDTCIDPDAYFELVENRKNYLGQSWSQLAGNVNVTQSSIKNYLKHYPPCTEESRELVSKALGISKSTLDKLFDPSMQRMVTTITQNFGPKYEEIKTQLTDFFGEEADSLRDIRYPAWKQDLSVKDECGRFVLNNEATKELLTVFSNKEDKVVSIDFISKLTEDQLESFVRTFVDTDGNVREQGGGFVVTQKVSERLDSIEFACILLGRTVTRYETNNSLSVDFSPKLVKPAYKSANRIVTSEPTISIHSPNFDGAIHPIHYVEGESKDSRRVEYYSGRVWCPETKNKTWLARHEGTVFYTGNSSEKPDSLRGPEHDLLVFDELAAFRNVKDVWSNAMLGLRLGNHPQAIVTTTPRPIKILRDLMGREGKDIIVRRGSTYDNKDNLPKQFWEEIVREYEGTSLARQEIYGELLDEIPGALWTREMIERNRLPIQKRPHIDFDRIIVAVDPSVGKDGQAGIIVCGRFEDTGYVIADKSKRGRPDQWAEAAIKAYHHYEADCIVAEKNNGGEMVRGTLNTIDPDVPVELVHAARGKMPRAEPVAGLTEQERWKFLGQFDELEDELCSYVPGEPSPDRMDAMVWGATQLILKRKKPINWKVY